MVLRDVLSSTYICTWLWLCSVSMGSIYDQIEIMCICDIIDICDWHLHVIIPRLCNTCKSVTLTVSGQVAVHIVTTRLRRCTDVTLQYSTTLITWHSDHILYLGLTRDELYKQHSPPPRKIAKYNRFGDWIIIFETIQQVLIYIILYML